MDVSDAVYESVSSPDSGDRKRRSTRSAAAQNALAEADTQLRLLTKHQYISRKKEEQPLFSDVVGLPDFPSDFKGSTLKRIL